MTDLEDHYPGDAAWLEFAALFRGEAARHTLGDELKQRLGGDEALADVILASVGAHALSWVAQAIPALSGLSPLDCLGSGRLVRRLRVMLLRFPR